MCEMRGHVAQRSGRTEPEQQRSHQSRNGHCERVTVEERNAKQRCAEDHEFEGNIKERHKSKSRCPSVTILKLARHTSDEPAHCRFPSGQHNGCAPATVEQLDT